MRCTVDLSICSHLSVKCGAAAVVFQWEMAFNLSFWCSVENPKAQSRNLHHVCTTAELCGFWSQMLWKIRYVFLKDYPKLLNKMQCWVCLLIAILQGSLYISFRLCFLACLGSCTTIRSRSLNRFGMHHTDLDVMWSTMATASLANLQCKLHLAKQMHRILKIPKRSFHFSSLPVFCLNDLTLKAVQEVILDFICEDENLWFYLENLCLLFQKRVWNAIKWGMKLNAA